MSILQEFIQGLASVFTDYIPALAAGIYNMFKGLFLTAGADGAVALNELGYIAIAFLGIAIVSGLVATVMGILKLKKKGGKRRGGRRARKTA